MALQSWRKNRGLQQRRDVVESCRNAASRRCFTMSRCSGLILGLFLAHFEPIIMGFKAQTIETTKEDDLEWILGFSEGE